LVQSVITPNKPRIPNPPNAGRGGAVPVLTSFF
jgi:hypothetical protein